MKTVRLYNSSHNAPPLRPGFLSSWEKQGAGCRRKRQVDVVHTDCKSCQCVLERGSGWVKSKVCVQQQPSRSSSPKPLDLTEVQKTHHHNLYAMVWTLYRSRGMHAC